MQGDGVGGAPHEEVAAPRHRVVTARARPLADLGLAHRDLVHRTAVPTDGSDFTSITDTLQVEKRVDRVSMGIGHELCVTFNVYNSILKLANMK